MKLLLAALGTYGLARAVARVGPLGAIVAALTFTFGSFVVAWLHAAMVDVVVWLPWLWWATARLIARPGPRPVAALAGVTALSLLAGHPESMPCISAATGTFAVFQIGQVSPRRPAVLAVRLSGWVAAYALGAVLAAAQLLPFAEYLTQSTTLLNRDSGCLLPSGLPLRYAWTLLSPDLFGNPAHGTWWAMGTNYNETNAYAGMLPLLLAGCALAVRERGQRRLVSFLLVVGGLALGVIYGAPGLADCPGAPVLGIARNNRLIFLVQLALGLLAALGVEALQQNRARRSLGPLLGASLVILGAVGIAVPWLGADRYFQVPTAPAWILVLWHTGLLRAAGWLGLSAAVLAVALAGGRTRPYLAQTALGLLPLLLLADLGKRMGTIIPLSRRPTTSPRPPPPTFCNSSPASSGCMGRIARWPPTPISPISWTACVAMMRWSQRAIISWCGGYISRAVWPRRRCCKARC